MNQKQTIKYITNISYVAALASIIGIIDKIIVSSIFPLIPSLKIGLANVIILYCIQTKTFKEIIIIVLLKSILVNLILGGITSFLIGGTASLISFLVMYICNRYLKKHLTTISISIIGGIIHINIQLLIIMFIYDIGSIVYTYGIYLILISIITSIIVGNITKKAYKTIKKIEYNK